MIHWTKIGKIFDPAMIKGKDWIKEFAQAPATLQFDDYVRVYFSCRPKADEAGRYVSYSSYVDLDRFDLRRIIRVADGPVVPLGHCGEFDEFGVYPVSPVRIGNEVWLYYGGWTRCESVPFNVAIGLAISKDDGRTFQKIGSGPILSYSPFEPFVISGPKIRRFGGQWQLFYIAGRKWKIVNGRPELVYKIRLATSSDGLHWTKLNRDLIPDRIGEDEAQASPDVYWDGEIYHMFFCYRYGSDYRNARRGYRIGYASSPNLIDWKRDDAVAGLLPSSKGWDAESVSYPHICEIDRDIYLFYLGNGVGRHGFGVARLRGKL